MVRRAESSARTVLNQKTAPVKKPATTMALLSRLVRDRVRRHAGTLVISAIFMILAAATTAANAWLMKPALDYIFIEHDPRMLWLVPSAVIAVSIIKGVTTYAQSMTMNHVGQRIMADMQADIFAHLMRADLRWLHQTHTGKLVSSFLYDATFLREAVSSGLTGIDRKSVV